MKVTINQLIEGCILSMDVISLTDKPILTKRTILDEQKLKVLHAFLIKEVHVESTLVNGEPYSPVDRDNEDGSFSFIRQYLKSVQEFKKLFQSWQGGTRLDISKICSFFIPLLKRAIASPSEIFMLHHYSTKEEYLYHHSVAVGLLSGFLGKKLNYNQEEWIEIALSGLLSDCGMAKVDRRILDKQSVLSPEEYSEIKLHPIHGYKFLKDFLNISEGIRLGIYQHHERIDGSGYPLGMDVDTIHQYAKIIAVSDVYHAMTAERAYRTKQSPFKVLELIIQDSFGQFDISVIQALVAGLANFSIGTKVKLSNDQVAHIMFIEDNSPTRPLVKIELTGEFIQLNKRRDIYIVELLS